MGIRSEVPLLLDVQCSNCTYGNTLYELMYLVSVKAIQ
jgi:hypothetical protein